MKLVNQKIAKQEISVGLSSWKRVRWRLLAFNYTYPTPASKFEGGVAIMAEEILNAVVLAKMMVKVSRQLWVFVYKVLRTFPEYFGLELNDYYEI